MGAKKQLKVAKLTDQLKHIRLQNDALRIQVEENTGQASLFFPSTHKSSNQIKTRSQGRGQVNRIRQSSNTQQLVQPPPSSPPSILQLGRPLETPKTAISQILEFITQNIHYIFEHLPPFIKSLIGIYRSFAYPSTKASGRTKTRTGVS